MPRIRVLTWNSGGDNKERAEKLQREIHKLNRGPEPKVGIVAIQEAAQHLGAIQTLLQRTTWKFKRIVNTRLMTIRVSNPLGATPEHCDETTQFQAISGVKGYLLCWRNKGNNSIGVESDSALSLIDFSGDSGVTGYCDTLSPAPRIIGELKLALKSQTRWPAYRKLVYHESQRVKRKIVLITWHAPYKPGLREVLDPHWRVGYKLSMLALQRSSWWTKEIRTLDNNGLAIIAGDLNADAMEANQGDVLPGWTRWTDTLQTIAAWSPGGPVTFSQKQATPGTSKDHNILSACIQWQ